MLGVSHGGGQYNESTVPIRLPFSHLLPSTKGQSLGSFPGDKEGGVAGWTLPLEVTKNPGKSKESLARKLGEAGTQCFLLGVCSTWQAENLGGVGGDRARQAKGGI